MTALSAASVLALPVVAADAAGDAPLLEWHLDTETAGSTPDSSGNGLSGSLVGAPAPATIVPGGRFGNAASFPTQLPNGSRVSVADSPTLQPAKVSVLLWVRQSGPPGTFRWLLGKGAQQSSGSSYGFSTGAAGGLQFGIFDGAGFRPSPDAGTSIWDGQWHAVAGTYDGATVRLYVDGAEVGTGTQNSSAIAYGLELRQLELGNYPRSVLNNFTYTFPGLIDEFRVYDHALSAGELAYLQRADHQTPPELPIPAGGGGPGGGGAGAGAPTVSGVVAARPIQAGQGAVLAAQGVRPGDRLAWNLTGDARPEVIGDPGQTLIYFRPKPGTVSVGVQAIAPGGATSPILTRPISIPAAPATPAGGAKVVTKLNKAGDVYATGGPEAVAILAGDALNKANCGLITRITTFYEGLKIQGCLSRINGIADIPLAERAALGGALYTLLYGRTKTVATPFIEYKTLVDRGTGFIADGSVNVNGVAIDPVGAARVVIYPQAKVIASSAARFAVGDLRLGEQRNFLVDTSVTGGRLPLGTFARSGAFRIGGFDLGADVKVAIVPQTSVVPAGAEITVSLKLPEWAETGGARFEGQVVVRATQDDGLILDKLDLGPASVDLGALSIDDFRITYTRADDTWVGQGRGCVLGGACLDMTPPNGRIVFAGGSLKEAGATLVFPPPGIPLYPGVVLDSFGFRFGVDPLAFGGSAQVTAIKIYRLNGRLLVAFPSSRAPYVPSVERDGPGFPAVFYGRPITTPAVAAAATASIDVPIIGRVPLGGGYFIYEYPGYVAFGGGVSQSFFDDLITLTGGVNGEFNAANGRFNLLGKTEACVNLPTPFGTAHVCASGQQVFISSRGFSACITEGVSIGAGATWSPFSVDIYFPDGCKWSPYAEQNVRGARAAQAGADYVVDVKAGDATRGIRFDSAQGAPRLRVTAPDGTKLETDESRPLQRAGQLSMLRSTKDHFAIVGLTNPRAGRYRIEQLPGGASVTKIGEAVSPPDARISASVAGTGAERELRYDILRRPSQTVTFVDVAGPVQRELGTVRGGGTGRLRFRTIPGGGTHRIEARFALHGFAAEVKSVATYRAPSARLPRPAAVRVVRRGTGLAVMWDAVPGAARYDVVATTSDAGQRLVRTRGLGAALKRIPQSTAGRVSVRGVDGARLGTARSVSFWRTKPRPTRLRRLPKVPAALRR